MLVPGWPGTQYWILLLFFFCHFKIVIVELQRRKDTWSLTCVPGAVNPLARMEQDPSAGCGPAFPDLCA